MFITTSFIFILFLLILFSINLLFSLLFYFEKVIIFSFDFIFFLATLLWVDKLLYFLKLYFGLICIGVVFLSSPSQVVTLPLMTLVWFLFELMLSYFGSDNWIYIKTLYWLCIWVCLYLGNIKWNVFMIFFIIMIISFKRMRNLNNLFET